MGKYKTEATIPTMKDPILLDNIKMSSSEMLGNEADHPLGPLEMLPKANLSMETPAPTSPPMRFGDGGCHIDLNDSPPEVEKLADDETVKVLGEGNNMLQVKADREPPTPASSPRNYGTGVCGFDLNQMPGENVEPFVSLENHFLGCCCSHVYMCDFS